MTDYISREAAVKAAQDGADEWDGGFNRNRDSYIECAIDQIPAADVVEVVHGEWKQTSQYKLAHGDEVVSEAYCTACELYSYQLSSFPYVGYDYCPRCGARMDGGADNA